MEDLQKLPMNLALQKTSPSDWLNSRPWQDGTAVCIGGGPSLDHAQIAHAHRFDFVIAVNDAYTLFPTADVLYACDLKWWDWHHRETSDFAGLKITIDAEAASRFPDLILMKGEAETGLSITPGILHQGQNSGYQALNLATLLGANRVILIGYDMKFADNGCSHWFGDHPDKIRTGSYEPWMMNFSTAASHAKLLGIDVINASRETAMTCFKRQQIEDIE